MEPVTDSDIRAELTRALEKPGATVTVAQITEPEAEDFLGRGTYKVRLKRKLVIEVEW